MIGALWTGISGLAAHQKALDNESHNIANVNTVGYKASRMSFADQMYQDKIGKGSKILDAEKIYTQGNLKVTGVSFDMALSGTGFFSVSNTRSSGASETFYTRAGNFRMGDNGTLQDSAGNEVQGWAMTPIDAYVDVNSSNPNVSAFTTDYSKLIASKIVKHSSYIETVTAKATDYTLTAKADSTTIYNGYGLKTQSGKVADIEALITDYSTWLQRLKTEPDGSSSTSTAQISTVNLPDSGGTGDIASEGDQVYIYIDGNKISQNWDTDYNTTMKLFVDKISTIPGIKAYTADATNSPSTVSSDVSTGVIRIESLIPGKAFSITEAGMIASNTTTLGSYNDVVEAEAGSGTGALQTSMAALKKAIVGKQQDVYTPDDLGTLSSTAMSYQISIYDQDLQRSIDIPASPKSFTASSVDNIVTAINANTSAAGELADYVKAYNINGNLVVKTLDSNADVEFAGTLKASYAVAEVQNILVSGSVIGSVSDIWNMKVAGIATGTVQFLGAYVADSMVGDTAIQTSAKIIYDQNNVINIWNSNHPAKEILSIEYQTIANPQVSTDLKIIFKKTEGDIYPIFTSANVSSGITFTPLTTGTVGINKPVTFLGTVVADSGGDDTALQTILKIISDKDNIIDFWNTSNSTKEIANISLKNGTTDTLQIEYMGSEGDVSQTILQSSNGITFGASTQIVQGVLSGANSFVTIDRNADYSGREGAGAEFMQIVNRIDQTATKGSLQLRLDTLGISDSAFGEFAVDSTGLMTMQQDGAEFAIGQIAIALFNNERGLEPIGDNLLKATSSSGQPFYNINNDKTAKLESQTLELSTADLSESLVNLMVFQRAFEANAKSITTSDELLNTLINLKR